MFELMHLNFSMNQSTKRSRFCKYGHQFTFVVDMLFNFQKEKKKKKEKKPPNPKHTMGLAALLKGSWFILYRSFG